MTPEWINAGASLMTLLVVALTAYAALQQMRHLRTGNQTAALLELVREQRDEQYQSSRDYVYGRLASDLEDPVVRAAIDGPVWSGPTRQALRFLQFYEELGALVFANALELGLVLRYFQAADDWRRVEAFVLVFRRKRGPSVWEMFEALGMAEAQYIAKHGDTWYPSGVLRTSAVDRWLEIDRGSDPARSA
jgi:hypothetical protein